MPHPHPCPRAAHLAAAMLSVLALGACGREARPHVVWIVIDALRADRVGAYGYRRDTTPTIDALAETSILFENAMAQESYTLASVPSYFTSTYPLTHRVLYNSPRIDVLDEGFVTIAEILRDQGYQTAAFVFNPSLKSKFGFAQGFDLYDDNPEGWPEGVPLHVKYETASKIHAKTERFLASRSDRPLFLYLHYRDVHDPYVPPPPYHQMFLAPGHRVEVDVLYPNGGFLALHEHPRLFRSQYDGEIRYTDDAIEEMMTLLAEHGVRRDNTVFILTADHGEEFLDRHPRDPGGSFHGRTLYREQIHVPLILSFPSPRLRARRYRSPVALVDIVPTVLDFLGIDPERFDQFQGRSLLGMIESEREREAIVYSGGNNYRAAILSGRWKFYRNDRALKSNRLKNFEQPEPGLEYDFLDQLYDLGSDPAERVDVIAEHPELARRFEEELERITVELSRPKLSSPMEMDEETRRQLEALGYIQTQ
jgi:arylsulfatase A-like enzyme